MRIEEIFWIKRWFINDTEGKYRVKITFLCSDAEIQDLRKLELKELIEKLRE